MKPEVGYADIVMGSFIEDLIDDIEHNMRLTKATDPYFEQLSVEKFTLEKLLREIGAHNEDPPTSIVARFVERMAASARESGDVNYIFSISRDAAQAILDGLYFD